MSEKPIEVQQFQETVPLKQRLANSTKLQMKYPNRVPVILLKSDKCPLKDLPKNKYLLPKKHNLIDLLTVIRKQLSDNDAKQAYILSVNNTLPSLNSNMNKLYEEFKDDDGLLYVVFSQEKTFG